MSNPRPCECGHPESRHGPAFLYFPESCFSCRPIVACWRYVPVKRTEPLRAKQDRFVAVRTLREFLDAEQQKAVDLRESVRPPLGQTVESAYADGLIHGLGSVCARFCD